MSKNANDTADQPLRETEQAAYHAYREWPILLVLKEKELAAPSRQSNAPEPVPHPDGTDSPAQKDKS